MPHRVPGAGDVCRRGSSGATVGMPDRLGPGRSPMCTATTPFERTLVSSDARRRRGYFRFAGPRGGTSRGKLPAAREEESIVELASCDREAPTARLSRRSARQGSVGCRPCRVGAGASGGAIRRGGPGLHRSRGPTRLLGLCGPRGSLAGLPRPTRSPPLSKGAIPGHLGSLDREPAERRAAIARPTARAVTRTLSRESASVSLRESRWRPGRVFFQTFRIGGMENRTGCGHGVRVNLSGRKRKTDSAPQSPRRATGPEGTGRWAVLRPGDATGAPGSGFVADPPAMYGLAGDLASSDDHPAGEVPR